MKYLTLLLLATTVLFTSCGDEETELPTCIDELLTDFKVDACSTADLTIWRFRGEEVYCFNWVPCFSDGTSDIYDANCTLICQLGGISGNPECANVDWESNAVLTETIFTQP